MNVCSTNQFTLEKSELCLINQFTLEILKLCSTNQSTQKILELYSINLLEDIGAVFNQSIYSGDIL